MNCWSSPSPRQPPLRCGRGSRNRFVRDLRTTATPITGLRNIFYVSSPSSNTLRYPRCIVSARLLRQHFHQLKLDPNFAILDGDEAKLMRSEIARRLFDDRYANDDTGRFQSLVDAYADGYDERLIGQVISAHETLRSVLDPDAWRARALDQIVEAIEKPMTDSILGQRCLSLIGEKISSLHERG